MATHIPHPGVAVPTRALIPTAPRRATRRDSRSQRPFWETLANAAAFVVMITPSVAVAVWVIRAIF